MLLQKSLFLRYHRMRSLRPLSLSLLLFWALIIIIILLNPQNSSIQKLSLQKEKQYIQQNKKALSINNTLITPCSFIHPITSQLCVCVFFSFVQEYALPNHAALGVLRRGGGRGGSRGADRAAGGGERRRDI